MTGLLIARLGRVCGLFCAVALALAWPASAATYQLAVTPAAPTFGQTIVFTGSYPQDARQKIGPQQHNNPVVQVACAQVGVLVFDEVAFFVWETNNRDGSWTGTTYPLMLAGPAWAGGPADCSATLYYWNKDAKTHALVYVFVASTSFAVAD